MSTDSSPDSICPPVMTTHRAPTSQIFRAASRIPSTVVGAGTPSRMPAPPAAPANPFLAFQLLAVESGPVVFTWVDDHGAIGRETAQVVVG